MRRDSYLKYCSSDLWAGDIPVTPNSFGFQFRGARIVRATITSLIEDKGMGSAEGTRLLFGGCSAGAIGAMNSLDAVAAMVPSTIRVQGLLDAAALVDIAPTGWGWSPDLVPLQQLISELVGVITPTFDYNCAAQYSGSEAWKCLFGQYRFPLLRTPFFANIPQFDDFEIMYDTDNLAPSTPAQYAFVNSFQPAILRLIDSLPAGTSVYSSTCLMHCLSGQSTFDAFTVNGISMSQAMSSWFFDGQQTRVISQCQGWQCTNACGATTTGLPCNIGDAGCSPLDLPTSVPDEPAPAGAPEVQGSQPWEDDQDTQSSDGVVKQQESSLNSGQQANLALLQ